jgi:hypothetical protein
MLGILYSLQRTNNMTIQDLHSRWLDTNICSVIEQILV